MIQFLSLEKALGGPYKASFTFGCIFKTVLRIKLFGNADVTSRHAILSKKTFLVGKKKIYFLQHDKTIKHFLCSDWLPIELLEQLL